MLLFLGHVILLLILRIFPCHGERHNISSSRNRAFSRNFTSTKVAVLIVGEARGFTNQDSISFNSVFNNALVPLSRSHNNEHQKNSVHVYVCLKGGQDRSQESVGDRVRRNFLEKGVEEVEGPTGVVLKSVTSAPLFTDFVAGTKVQGKAALHRTERCFNDTLMMGMAHYDWYVRVRPDALFFSPLPALSSLDSMAIHVRARAATNANLTSWQASAAPCIAYGCDCTPCYIFDDQLAVVPGGRLASVYFNLYSAYRNADTAAKRRDPHGCISAGEHLVGFAEKDFTLLLLQSLSFGEFSLLNVSANVYKHPSEYTRNSRSFVEGQRKGVESRYQC
jgi:hypothetical protein